MNVPFPARRHRGQFVDALAGRGGRLDPSSVRQRFFEAYRADLVAATAARIAAE